MIHRLFGTTNSSWSGAVRSCTNSRQVSWLKDLRPPPPSQSNASVAGARSTRAAGSLITVTRSCGICTRFPFNVPAAQKGLQLVLIAECFFQIHCVHLVLSWSLCVPVCFPLLNHIFRQSTSRPPKVHQNAKRPNMFFTTRWSAIFWSRIRDSNPPPTAWEAVALPDELTLHTALSL